jgi:hypothetical protein
MTPNELKVTPGGSKVPKSCANVNGACPFNAPMVNEYGDPT